MIRCFAGFTYSDVPGKILKLSQTSPRVYGVNRRKGLSYVISGGADTLTISSMRRGAEALVGRKGLVRMMGVSGMSRQGRRRGEGSTRKDSNSVREATIRHCMSHKFSSTP